MDCILLILIKCPLLTAWYALDSPQPDLIGCASPGKCRFMFKPYGWCKALLPSDWPIKITLATFEGTHKWNVRSYSYCVFALGAAVWESTVSTLLRRRSVSSLPSVSALIKCLCLLWRMPTCQLYSQQNLHHAQLLFVSVPQSGPTLWTAPNWIKSSRAEHVGLCPMLPTCSVISCLLHAK